MSNNSSRALTRTAAGNPVVRPISAADHLAFVRAQRSVSFLQTPAWGRVKTEWRSESLGWFDGPRLVGAGLVLHRPVPRLDRYTLAYLPEGPVIDWSSEIGAWLDPLAAYLKEHGAFAIRLGPPVVTDTWDATQIKDGIADPQIRRLTDMPGRWDDPVGARVSSQLKDAGWLPQNPLDGFGVGHPQFKYVLPLAGRTEDELLRGMNQQWRRNIKKSAKEGVEVTVSDGGPEDLKAFHDLYVHTAERDRFTPRPLSYFETMFTALRAEDPERIKIYLAHHQGDLVAATVMVRVGSHAVYSYGASATAKREVRGSNACQWAMIRDALAADCDVYDLRGITPTLDADDPHVGLVRFKVGTGGQAVRYVGEWDLPLRPMIYRAFDLYMRRRGH
ncbi:aminoacyltransferase [Streptomyces coelicolor]|uniref:Peptidoglycan bridge formation protein FemAB n=1 Tax=Streptomyces toyocaensis TaxID=55952 RepID=Q8KLJ8_STRTO|nr:MULTISPECIES: peptidoglycan bridge formation glycyltransferase FemA/FemB family protein [Streptomyces]AAM80555.1 StaO [Streptomyces toyocaensis]KES08690.1 peptidoglycan bridge formation protein FemAB [Streptomyces toyocaensis]NSL78881.1 aminoacyltransferase [Streptomyces coelicolor]QKN67430.1 aminoacyltransferase [Streptomyces coelicolor]